jgi:glycerol-3-phosphate acyltransferase PlsY
LKILFVSLLAYLLGSVPTGLLIAKRRGVDLRKSGSGNIGATNVLRTTGKGAAVATLAGDVLKGSFAALIGRYVFPGNVYAEGAVGLCAILGHDFSCFLKLRGGKGVATSLGVLGVYAPSAGLFAVIVWAVTVLITRYSSLGALISFGLLPVGTLLFDTREKLPLSLLVTTLLYIRHKDNIKRLAAGEEPRIGGKT